MNMKVLNYNTPLITTSINATLLLCCVVVLVVFLTGLRYQLKGVSFLPNDNSSYAQMPYEEIDKNTYLFYQFLFTLRVTQCRSLSLLCHVLRLPNSDPWRSRPY